MRSSKRTSCGSACRDMEQTSGLTADAFRMWLSERKEGWSMIWWDNAPSALPSTMSALLSSKSHPPSLSSLAWLLPGALATLRQSVSPNRSSVTRTGPAPPWSSALCAAPRRMFCSSVLSDETVGASRGETRQLNLARLIATRASSSSSRRKASCFGVYSPASTAARKSTERQRWKARLASSRCVAKTARSPAAEASPSRWASAISQICTVLHVTRLAVWLIADCAATRAAAACAEAACCTSRRSSAACRAASKKDWRALRSNTWPRAKPSPSPAARSCASFDAAPSSG
mmetsp:Transcript_23781/g.57319  ORF Transcript_23781/g.57319 Transcript_23781/m.57319 type:complete len:289 (+) Transcript_23781:1358-2224(+)